MFFISLWLCIYLTISVLFEFRSLSPYIVPWLVSGNCMSIRQVSVMSCIKWKFTVTVGRWKWWILCCRVAFINLDLVLWLFDINCSINKTYQNLGLWRLKVFPIVIQNINYLRETFSGGKLIYTVSYRVKTESWNSLYSVTGIQGGKQSPANGYYLSIEINEPAKHQGKKPVKRPNTSSSK